MYSAHMSGKRERKRKDKRGEGKSRRKLLRQSWGRRSVLFVVFHSVLNMSACMCGLSCFVIVCLFVRVDGDKELGESKEEREKENERSMLGQGLLYSQLYASNAVSLWRVCVLVLFEGIARKEKTRQREGYARAGAPVILMICVKHC